METSDSHAQSLSSGAAESRDISLSRQETEWQAKKSIHFDYVVPQILSGYSIKMGAASAIVGYHGSFYADPVTFDMERIEVIADDLPSELMLSAAS